MSDCTQFWSENPGFNFLLQVMMKVLKPSVFPFFYFLFIFSAVYACEIIAYFFFVMLMMTRSEKFGIYF
jgi:hypothetical protein